MSNLLICLLVLIIGYLLSINYFRKNYLKKIQNTHKLRVGSSFVPGYHPTLWQVYLRISVIDLNPYVLIILGYYYAYTTVYLIILLAIIVSFLEFAVWEERIEYVYADRRMKNFFFGVIVNLFFFAGGGFLISYIFETNNIILPLLVVLVMETLQIKRYNKLPFYRH